MRRPRPGRPEPAEAAVVAVVGGERAVRAVADRDVDAGRRERERARELERPRAAELGRDRVEQRALVGPGAADLVAAGRRGRRELAAARAALTRGLSRTSISTFSRGSPARAQPRRSSHAMVSALRSSIPGAR